MEWVICGEGTTVQPPTFGGVIGTRWDITVPPYGDGRQQKKNMADGRVSTGMGGACRGKKKNGESKRHQCGAVRRRNLTKSLRGDPARDTENRLAGGGTAGPGGTNSSVAEKTSLMSLHNKKRGNWQSARGGTPGTSTCKNPFPGHIACQGRVNPGLREG